MSTTRLRARERRLAWLRVLNAFDVYRVQEVRVDYWAPIYEAHQQALTELAKRAWKEGRRVQ